MTNTDANTSHLYNTADHLDERDLHPGRSVALLHKNGNYYFWDHGPICTTATEHANKEDASTQFREAVFTALDDTAELTIIEQTDMGSDHLLGAAEYDGHFYSWSNTPAGADATEHGTETGAIQQLREEIADLAKVFSEEDSGTHWESVDADQWVVTCTSQDGHVAAWCLDGESDYATFNNPDEAEEHAEAVLLEHFSNEASNENAGNQAEQVARIDAALAVSAAGDSIERRGHRHLHDALLDIAMDSNGPPVNVSTLAARMGVSRQSLYRWYPFLSSDNNS